MCVHAVYPAALDGGASVWSVFRLLSQQPTRVSPHSLRSGRYGSETLLLLTYQRAPSVSQTFFFSPLVSAVERRPLSRLASCALTSGLFTNRGKRLTRSTFHLVRGEISSDAGICDAFTHSCVTQSQTSHSYGLNELVQQIYSKC